MWFKNITLLTLPAAFNVDVAALEPALAEHPLRSPGPLEMETRGFVSPFARDAGVQGLAQLGRNAIERVSELERGIAERDETIRQLRAHLGSLLAVIHRDGGHYQSAHGTAKAIDDAIRIVAERNAQLDEYGRAPTVAYVNLDRWKVCSNPEDCFSREREEEWDEELIARPARKGE